MPKKTPYDRIPLVPAIIAETVCSHLYTGAEWSVGTLSPTDISKVEVVRQKMTPARLGNSPIFASRNAGQLTKPMPSGW